MEEGGEANKKTEGYCYVVSAPECDLSKSLMRLEVPYRKWVGSHFSVQRYPSKCVWGGLV